MASPLKPSDLTRAPSLQRLLTPNETLLYTVRFHYLRGWWVLALALGCFAASYQWPLAILPFLVLMGLWYLPLHTNEVAVTNDRLLLRTGWMRIVLQAIEDQNIIRWELTQNALGSMLDCGTVLIWVREAASSRQIVLDWVSHPVVLLEALQALQDEKYAHATE
jgi:uncharacterized membrane protein YdbT with pleckstrin-like domain